MTTLKSCYMSTEDTREQAVAAHNSLVELVLELRSEFRTAVRRIDILNSDLGNAEKKIEYLLNRRRLEVEQNPYISYEELAQMKEEHGAT